jgi:membrane fusion protein (multidrug efflux system)
MKAKYVIAGVILVALAIAGGLFFRSMEASPSMAQQAPPSMPPPEVSVVTVKPQPLTLYKDLPGRTSAFRVAEIRPQVNGIITKRLFEEGSDVTEGQQLYQIDPAPYQAAYDSTLADLQKAEANVKSVEAKAARYAELVKIGGISKQDYDDASASLAQSTADIAIAQAAVATAKINLDYTKVFSPIAGRIGQSVVTEGALVTANQAMPLATVQQFDKIYVDVTQSSGELMQLRSQYAHAEGAGNASAQLVIDGKEYGGAGTLQFSDVSVNQTTNTVQLRILFPNENHEILPGLFVHARLVQTKDDAAILVPQQAIARNPDGSVTVWVIGADDKAEIRPIKIADTVGDRWQVLEGLKAGDRVVVEGVMKIQPGAIVKPVEKDAPAPETQATP